MLRHAVSEGRQSFKIYCVIADNLRGISKLEGKSAFSQLPGFPSKAEKQMGVAGGAAVQFASQCKPDKMKCSLACGFHLDSLESRIDSVLGLFSFE